MIEVRAKKKLGEFSLDAELRDEGFICLTGRNGAGKSTFLNVIAGVSRLDDGGYVRIGSRDVTTASVEKRGIVLVTPDSYIPHMRVEKHLAWGANLKGATIDPAHVERVRSALGVTFDGKVQKLSLGMKERVALATALLSKPQIILIDESFSNIDNRGIFIFEFRRLCAESKLDAIFTTQFEEDAKLADHHYAMEKGKVTKIF